MIGNQHKHLTTQQQYYTILTTHKENKDLHNTILYFGF